MRIFVKIPKKKFFFVSNFEMFIRKTISFRLAGHIFVPKAQIQLPSPPPKLFSTNHFPYSEKISNFSRQFPHSKFPNYVRFSLEFNTFDQPTRKGSFWTVSQKFSEGYTRKDLGKIPSR